MVVPRDEEAITAAVSCIRRFPAMATSLITTRRRLVTFAVDVRDHGPVVPYRGIVPPLFIIAGPQRCVR